MLSVAGAQVALSQAFAASTTETVSLLLTGGFDHLSLLSCFACPFVLHLWIWTKLPYPPPWQIKDNCHLHLVDQGGLPSELPEMVAITRILNQCLIPSITDPSPALWLKTVQISIKQKYLLLMPPVLVKICLLNIEICSVKFSWLVKFQDFRWRKSWTGFSVGTRHRVLYDWFFGLSWHVYKIQDPRRM